MQRHITDNVDFSKFGVPSWRIEQRYNNGVLIGNWSEERQAVRRKNVTIKLCIYSILILTNFLYIGLDPDAFL